MYGNNQTKVVVQDSGGVSIVGLLGVVFITLKLIGIIDWDWIWVLAPFWGGLALVLVALLLTGFVLLVLTAWNGFQNWRWKKKRLIERLKVEEDRRKRYGG